VTAGVYLLCRINPILGITPGALDVVAWVGAITALYAATIACAQDDIKRVLAYSTISQLGYMFLAVGSGAYVAGIFHMVTHAFFKALLFLAAGSVIHGLHDEQNMKRMGGLRKYMPITFGCFIAGWLAIAGVPPFAGFWSKDDILANAWQHNRALWVIGIVTALLTAYYMSRQVFLVFWGDERWKHDGESHGQPHEAPWTMALPLVVLALLSVVGGALNLPFSKKTEVLANWLHPVFGERLHELGISTNGKWALAGTAVALGLIGITFAVAVFLRGRVDPERLEPAVLKNGWYVDDLYAAIIETPGRLIAAFSAFVIDTKVIDGAVNGIGSLVRNGGERLRQVQTGYVRNYALGVAAGAVLILGYVVGRTGLG
jgi:NADH-quinone oxidoreductase subunit L